jgi:hypothetical protein
MPFIKLNQPKYLSEGQYLIADTDPDSTYFEVSEVPDILTGGKNLFMIKGNRDLLAPGSIIEIEVTDLNGRSVYHENAVYLEPGTKRRAVAVYVYKHTPQGGGTITITGTAQKRPNGKSISLELQKTPNVKWQKQINILPKNENVTRVILNKEPAISIVEIARSYLTPSGSLQTTYQINTSSGISHQPNYGNPYITTTSSYFGSADEGTEVWLNGGTVSSQYLNELQGYGTLYLVNGFPINPYVTITSVENSTKAYISQPLQYATTYTTPESIEEGGAFSLNIEPAVSGMTMVHNQPNVVSYLDYNTNIESWAKVFVSELDPICGDIKRLKTFRRSQGFQQWHTVSDVVLEDYEILSNNDSNGLSRDIGQFYNQDVVNDYWTASYQGTATAVGQAPVTASDGAIFINAVVVSGSENLKTNFATTREDAYIEFKMKPSADFDADGDTEAGVELLSGGNYTLTLKLASQPVDDGGDFPQIRIYASGSAVDGIPEDGYMKKLDTIITSQTAYTPIVVVPDELIEQGVEQNVFIPTLNETVDPSLLSYDFEITKKGLVSIIFQIQAGKWWISDVSLRTTQQSGWTPNHTIIEFPIGQTQQGDVNDFKFELYDNIGNKVHTKYIYGVSWAGSNTAISGTNNTIEGALIIGNGIIFEGVSVT